MFVASMKETETLTSFCAALKWTLKFFLKSENKKIETERERRSFPTLTPERCFPHWI